MNKKNVDWFKSPLGDTLIGSTLEAINCLIPTTYYPTSLQLGLDCFNFLENIDSGLLIHAGEFVSKEKGLCIRTLSGELPLSNRSVNLAILPFVLDFESNPHNVIRETIRILAPEGILIVCGFNRWSLWGLRRAFEIKAKKKPWNGVFLSTTRIQDWFRLLGLELISGEMVFYRPPINHPKMLQIVRFLEPAGNRWWPMAGGCYIVVAQKQISGKSQNSVIRRKLGKPTRRSFSPVITNSRPMRR